MKALTSILAFVFLILVHLLAGCGLAELRPFPVDMSVGIPDASASPEDGDSYSVSQGGALPPGYYGLQCQWDACEPPPTKSEPAKDPVR